jgi:CPA2 family monovalent cation:H+ antiporter-2
MPDLSLLYELFVVFASAIVVVLLFHRLQVSHIVGFLICGMVVGPHGLHLIARHESIEALAEIGVVLLLFAIGLEFSLAELRRMKRDVLLGGSLQVLATAAMVFGIAVIFGMGLPRAFFLGQMLALSSTAVVLSVLAQRREVDTSQGRIILGVLLFQDLCVVPMMLLTPLLGGSGEVQIFAILFSLGKALLLISVVMVLAMFVVPRVLEVIVRVRLRDVLVLGVVIICIGTAWLTSALGLSLALGAFIAGLAISESPYSHQVVAEILPFKDVFNSLFFISIGMLLNLKFFGEHFAVLLLLVAGVLLIKTIAGGFAVKLLSGSTRLALIVGLSVSQVGEFSFILAKFGVQYQLLDTVLYQSFLAVSVMTMVVTPFLMTLAPPLCQALARALG